MYTNWIYFKIFCINRLTLYHTIPNFNDPRKEDFEKHCGNQDFLLFPVFSTLHKWEVLTLATFDFALANAFNLVKSKIFSFGKKLTDWLHRV